MTIFHALKNGTLCQHITDETWFEMNQDEIMVIDTEPSNKGKFLYLCPVCAKLVRERVLSEYFQKAATEYLKSAMFNVKGLDDDIK